MASTGYSLHLGLNTVNPAHYEGWDGQLAACEFDARDMQALAAKQGLRTQVLLTRQATADAVIASLRAAASVLKSGDLYLITYSGHGGQVPDLNHDERDPGRQDETWVLWDRQLVDDELWALWSKFKPGVRIVVLSDSCHSGTITRRIPVPGAKPLPRTRLLPPIQADRVYRAHRSLYDDVQRGAPAGERVKVRATVLLISGCQDNQFSLDGDRNGLFTETLKKVWRGGAFKGGYRKFRDAIAQRMPSDQTPNYSLVGKANPEFEAQRPFTV